MGVELGGKIDHDPEPRLIACELEPAAMEARDRGNQRQPEAAALFADGRRKTHEGLPGTKAVFGGDARAVVAHDQAHAAGKSAYRHLDAPTRGYILERVLDEVGEQLREELS